MQNEIDLSIIIVNYKSGQYIKRCIVSVREKIKDLSFEIIIINNDSMQLSELSSDNVKIINSGENIGFGRANNLGTEEAQGKYILFLNPDTLLLTDNIKKIIREFERDKKIGIIGSKLVDELGNAEKWSVGYETNIINLIRNNLGITKSRKIWESQEKTETDCVSGAAMFIKKELFDNVGGFDEIFFMYFEDEDLCKRARQAGYKIIYFPEFTIKHFCGKSFENEASQNSDLKHKAKSSEAPISFHQDSEKPSFPYSVLKQSDNYSAKEGKKSQKDYFYASQDYYFQKHFGKITGWTIRVLRKILRFNLRNI